MDWLNPFTIIVVSSGLIFWAGALYFERRPPTKINLLYGYRTQRSMASQEAWDYAQRFSCSVMDRSGRFMILLGGLWTFLPIAETYELVEVVASVLVVIGTCIHLLIVTEKELKREFGK